MAGGVVLFPTWRRPLLFHGFFLATPVNSRVCWRVKAVLACLLVFAAFPSGSLAQPPASSSALEARFRTEYPLAAKKLEAASRMVHCVADLVFGEPEDPKYFVMKTTIFTAGDARVSTIEFTEQNHKESSKSSVYCMGRGYYFQLDKPSRNTAYSVVDLHKDAGPSEAIAGSLAIRLDFIPRFAYSIFETSVLTLMNHPSFKIQKVSDLSEKRDQSKVEIVFRVADSSHWITGGSLVFAPDLDWALLGYDLEVDPKHRGITFGIPAGTTFRGRLSPRRWPSGHVFSEEGESRFIYPKGLDRKDPKKSFRVSSVEFVDVPDSQFRPSAFGLPDTIIEPARSRSFGLNYAFILGGMLFLVLSIVLKRVSTRRVT
jgi:hypothetical protein